MWVHCIWYIFHLWSLLELELMLAPLEDALRLCVPTKDDAEADDSSASGEFQLYPNIPFMKAYQSRSFLLLRLGMHSEQHSSFSSCSSYREKRRREKNVGGADTLPLTHERFGFWSCLVDGVYLQSRTKLWNSDSIMNRISTDTSLIDLANYLFGSV